MRSTMSRRRRHNLGRLSKIAGRKTLRTRDCPLAADLGEQSPGDSINALATTIIEPIVRAKSDTCRYTTFTRARDQRIAISSLRAGCPFRIACVVFTRRQCALPERQNCLIRERGVWSLRSLFINDLPVGAPLFDKSITTERVLRHMGILNESRSTVTLALASWIFTVVLSFRFNPNFNFPTRQGVRGGSTHGSYGLSGSGAWLIV